MLAAPHLITGAAIAIKLGSFSLPTALLAILSHVILDAIPHRDEIDERGLLSTRQIIVSSIDVLAGMALVYFVFKDNLALAGFGAFWGLFPDFINQSKIIFPQVKQNKIWQIFRYYHNIIQKIKPNWFWGLLTQIVVIVLILIWVYYF